MKVANPMSVSFKNDLTIDNYILYLIQATYVKAHEELAHRKASVDIMTERDNKIKETKDHLDTGFNSLLDIPDADTSEGVRLLKQLFEAHSERDDGMLNHNEVLNNLLYNETLCNTGIISSKYVDSNRFLDISRVIDLGITDKDPLELLFDTDDMNGGKMKERPTINLKKYLKTRREKRLDAFLVSGGGITPLADMKDGRVKMSTTLPTTIPTAKSTAEAATAAPSPSALLPSAPPYPAAARAPDFDGDTREDSGAQVLEENVNGGFVDMITNAFQAMMN